MAEGHPKINMQHVKKINMQHITFYCSLNEFSWWCQCVVTQPLPSESWQ